MAGGTLEAARRAANEAIRTDDAAGRKITTAEIAMRIAIGALVVALIGAIISAYVGWI